MDVHARAKNSYCVHSPHAGEHIFPYQKHLNDTKFTRTQGAHLRSYYIFTTSIFMKYKSTLVTIYYVLSVQFLNSKFLFTSITNITKQDKRMVKQKLPCAEKNCKGKMILIEHKDNTLCYRCLKKPDEHNFKYNITHKKWEKIITKNKLILHYNQNPCQEQTIYEID